MSKGSWGGPAKGPGNGGVKAEPFAGRVAGNACDDNRDPDEQAYRAAKRAEKRKRRDDAWKALDNLVADTAHPAHFQAAKETLNRIDGMPTQKTVLTGEDDGPVKIETIRRVIIDPRNTDA